VHVMAVSAVSDDDRFWSSMKKAHARLPKGAAWTVAVRSTDGTRAVNVIVDAGAGGSVDGVRGFLAEYTDPFATTEYFEIDAANAVGLPVAR
jgi:hypothetical protein